MYTCRCHACHTNTSISLKTAFGTLQSEICVYAANSTNISQLCLKEIIQLIQIHYPLGHEGINKIAVIS